MAALRRASGAWRWVLCIWLAELLTATLGGYGVRSHIAAVMDGFVLPDDHLLYGLVEFTHAHPQLVISIVVTLATSTLLGFLLWTVLAPLVLLRLGRHADAPAWTAAALGSAWLGSLGGAVATSAWHLGLRVVVVIIAGQAVASLPGSIGLPLVIVLVLASTCALDFSRVAVVTGGARGASPRTAIDGYAVALRRPLLVLAMAAVAGAQWLVVVAGLVAVLRTGGDALALMRACAAGATLLGFFRLALALSVRPAAPTASDAD